MAATKSKRSSLGRRRGGMAKGKSAGRCWSGYEPVSGKKPFSKGSCRKKG